MHRKVAAALVAVLALALAGCGGSGDSEQTSLTRAELVRRLEQACRDGQRVGVRAAREAGGTDSPSQRAFVEAALASQRFVNEKIDDYDTSGAAKADLEDLQAAFRERVEAIERIAAVDGAEQTRAIRAAGPQLETAQRKAATAARNLGIVGCT